jgi:hypothetical protein
VLLSKLWFSMLNYSCADLEGMESQWPEACSQP